MSKQTEEQSSKFFIFGNREIKPVGYPIGQSKRAYTEADFGTFEMVDGQNSKPAKFIGNPEKTWIPIDIAEPMKANNINKKPTYAEILIMFGKLHFGAIWNEEENQFEVTDESNAWHFTSAIDKTKYLAKFRNMNVGDFKVAQSPKENRFHYDKDGDLRFIDGFGTDKMSRYLRVVKAYNNPSQENIDKGIKPILGKRQTGEERARAKRKLSAKPETPTEADDVVRNKFYIQPNVQGWKDKLIERKVQNPDAKLGAIFRIFAINNMLFSSEDLTVGMKGKSLEDKINKLKEINAVWKRWNKQFYTDENFYKESWTDPLYKAGKEELHFPDGIWETLSLFPEREHKRGKPRKFDGIKKEESSRKTGADLLVSFVVNAPKDAWTIEKQPAETMLSRKIGEPDYGSQGQNITDKHIRQAMKFLETGKSHTWEHMKKDGRLVYESLVITNPDQTEDTKFFKIEELVPVSKEDDPDPHYNESLKEYDWSDDHSPYGKTKPASLFFRIGILCGWRKMEALTCPTRETSTKQLNENKKYWKSVSYKEKPSGLIMDEEQGVLDIAFLTRKTKKTGAGFFEAIIPPFSSSVMDTRDTIAYVMEKAGIGRWKDPDFYNWTPVNAKLGDDEKETPIMVRTEKKDWKGEVVRFKPEELKKIFPELRVAGKIVRKAGEHSKILLGEDGQFFSKLIFVDKDGHSMANYDAPTGTDLNKLENKEMVRAYLDFPLVEAYAQMKGTTVRYESSTGILAKANEDRKIMKELSSKFTLKVFRLKNNWADILFDPDDPTKKIVQVSASKDRMDQDTLRYLTKAENWWLGRTIHSIRHIFAQLWLAKSKWNFGIVADRGHWETLDTLKKHYGDVPPTVQAGFMVQVFSTTGGNKIDGYETELNAGISGKIVASGVATTIAETQFKESEEESEGVVVESEAETQKKLEEKVKDV